MRHNMLRRSFIAFHITLCVVIFIQSINTALHSASSQKHSNLALAIFASAEAIAALLFLVPVLMKWAGSALLLIFAIAIALHAVQGEFPSALLLYAAGVCFVMAHGSAFGKGAPVQQAHAA
jgi:hypothetical protein